MTDGDAGEALGSGEGSVDGVGVGVVVVVVVLGSGEGMALGSGVGEGVLGGLAAAPVAAGVEGPPGDAGVKRPATVRALARGPDATIAGRLSCPSVDARPWESPEDPGDPLFEDAPTMWGRAKMVAGASRAAITA